MAACSSNLIWVIFDGFMVIIQGPFCMDFLATLVDLVFCYWDLGFVLRLEVVGGSGYKQVLCLSAASTLINIVRKGLNVFHKDENFIWTIKQFLLRDWMVNLQNTLLKSNDTTDFQVKKGALIDNDFVVFHKTFNASSIFLANVMNVEFVQLSLGSLIRFVLFLFFIFLFFRKKIKT